MYKFVYKFHDIPDFSGFIAEREGFEPPVPLGTTVFKTVVIDHSTISPLRKICNVVQILKRVQR